jgi:hypothetical protein
MIKNILIVAAVIWGIGVVVPLFSGQPELAAKVFMSPVTLVIGGLEAIATFVQTLAK